MHSLHEDNSKVHSLKTNPDSFADLSAGVKNFTVRRNDRKFSSNDYVLLREYDENKGAYTGNDFMMQILKVYEPADLPAECQFDEEFCILSLTREVC